MYMAVAHQNQDRETLNKMVSLAEVSNVRIPRPQLRLRVSRYSNLTETS